MHVVTQAQVKEWLPVRLPQAHKGQFGRVLVVAGSRSMCGAGFLCAKSALTVGAGLVYWALPASMQPAFAAALPEVITIPLPETPFGYIDASAWELFPELCATYKPSLMVVGPGMGASPLLPTLLQNEALPLVVDADALNALARQEAWHTTWPKERPAIFTPHSAEMGRLLGKHVDDTPKARQEQVSTLAQLTQGVCILKGKHTLTAGILQQSLHITENTTGSVALAKGGSGDVLSGCIAGLWAQLGTAEGFSTYTAWKASVSAVYLHGLAGQLAQQRTSIYSVLAQDVIAQLPQAIRHVQGEL